MGWGKEILTGGAWAVVLGVGIEATAHDLEHPLLNIGPVIMPPEALNRAQSLSKIK